MICGSTATARFFCGVEPVVAGDGVDVAVEHQADDLAACVDQRAAGVAADDVVVGREVEARLQVERVASPCSQLSGIRKGSLPVARSNRRAQVRERLDLRAVLVPALHRAVVQPQREGGIRVDAGAERLEAGARDLLRRRRRPAPRPRPRSCLRTARAPASTLRASTIMGSVRGIDGGRAAFPQRLAHGRVGELGAVDQLLRQRVGRILRQQLAHERVRPGPSHSRMRSRPNDSVSFSSSG